MEKCETLNVLENNFNTKCKELDNVKIELEKALGKLGLMKEKFHLKPSVIFVTINAVIRIV